MKNKILLLGKDMYLQLNRVRHFLICTQNCARKSIWFFKIYTLSPIYVQIVKVYQHPSEPVTMNSFMLVVEKPGGVGDCKSQLTGCLVKCILCIPILICTPPPKKKTDLGAPSDEPGEIFHEDRIKVSRPGDNF